MSYDGIDIYRKFQTVTDWAAVRASGKAFAYLKGTDGLTTRDTGDWPKRARAAGIAVGLYGYAQPGTAADQYDLLLRTAVDRAAVDLAPALDLENPFVPGNQAVAFAVAWLQRAVSIGWMPVYYANDSMMTYTLPAIRAAVPTVWPWIARYGAQPKNPFRTWQHSSSGTVPGITASAVDLDTGDIPLTLAQPPASPAGQTGVEIMERRTVPPSPDTTAIRLLLSGSPGSAVVVRPRIDGDGVAKNPVWIGNIFAWGSDKSGVGHNPKNVVGNDSKLMSHRRYELPGAVWADLEYSSKDPFEIDIVG